MRKESLDWTSRFSFLKMQKKLVWVRRQNIYVHMRFMPAFIVRDAYDVHTFRDWASCKRYQ